MVRFLPGPTRLFLLTCAAAVAAGSPAQAVLSIYIYESGSDVQIDASGTLNLPGPLQSGPAQQTLGVIPSINLLGTGALRTTKQYNVGAGPSGSLGTGGISGTSTGSGTAIYLFGTNFLLDDTYTSGASILSSATIANKTLAQLGLSSTSGLLAT